MRRRVGKLERACKAELVQIGKAETDIGIAAMATAARIDDADAEMPGSAFASLMKEYRATMAEARQVGKGKSDRLDELADRRRKRLAGA